MDSYTDDDGGDGNVDADDDDHGDDDNEKKEEKKEEKQTVRVGLPISEYTGFAVHALTPYLGEYEITDYVHLLAPLQNALRCVGKKSAQSCKRSVQWSPAELTMFDHKDGHPVMRECASH
ncbi:hypothetical protein PoB_002638100 [Plakobranchus ocellatus]|uniref:Uncharacterized protein n=1 Tax=Plakobranchus ocellatus TaxID=259542 RepID=A0AAV3ZL84_9GAST|nr:hypothetical protein PoB_002638100 [Plakobranchus ocellatus]